MTGGSNFFVGLRRKNIYERKQGKDKMMSMGKKEKNKHQQISFEKEYSGQKFTTRSAKSKKSREDTHTVIALRQLQPYINIRITKGAQKAQKTKK
jgi:hypothetical protein